MSRPEEQLRWQKYLNAREQALADWQRVARLAFRQYRASGATRSTAATVMILSGLASSAALVLLYVTGLSAVALRPLVRLGQRHPMVTLGGGLGVLAVLGAAAEIAAHRSRCAPHCHRWHGPQVAAAVHRRWPRIGHALHSGSATVLVYRLLSCWLIIPIGFLAWARLRHLPVADAHQADAPVPAGV